MFDRKKMTISRKMCIFSTEKKNDYFTSKFSTEKKMTISRQNFRQKKNDYFTSKFRQKKK